MGEAKRRKKLMGEDYGKKRQTIIRGTEELDTHLLLNIDSEKLNTIPKILNLRN